jgi:hypothetical protein
MAKPLPPTVGERLAKCGTHVDVWGVVPGAKVTLDVAGVQKTQPAGGTSMTFTIPGLNAGDKVRARQQVGSDTSEWSNRVITDDVKLPPNPPLTEATISSCAQCISAWGAAPGSRIEITLGGQKVAEGETSRTGLACMEAKHKPSSSMQSKTITCGTPSPSVGNIGVYSSPSPLPAPIIVDPVFECQTQVRFEGLVPGATVEIFVTDRANVTNSLGTFCACASRVNANVGRRFEKGDRVKAEQRMIRDQWECNVRGTPGPDVKVVPPDSRIKPKIVDPLYEGDVMILVTNQIEGGTITLLSKASAADPEVELGSRPSSEHPELPVPGPALHAGQILRVIQELCGVKEFSDPVTVKGRPPRIDPPEVRKPLYGCGEVVAIDKVIPGAWVYVRQTPPNVTSPEFPIGKVKALGTSVVVQVAPLLESGCFVTAHQEVGGQPSGPAPFVKVVPRQEFPAPKIVPPVAVGNRSVWLEEVVPGAHLRIFDRGIQMGSGSLPDTDGLVDLWWPIPDRAILTATQALCRFESSPSPPTPATSAAPCDGPPVYNPGKWNDGGKIQGCNNCYNYACDIRTDNFAQPGGGLTSSQLNCPDVVKAALSDGLRLCTTNHCHPCHHRVALVVAPGNDYHWYRQDAGGFWSHKRGCQAAKNVDESNNPITDPSTADRGPYTGFCGYFCVYKPDAKIGGPGCNCWP